MNVWQSIKRDFGKIGIKSLLMLEFKLRKKKIAADIDR